MAAIEEKAKLALGFLTVVEYPDHGLFGGYLLLNAAGRPLEFHCTAPIKPNRAQEILYGPTLASFLYGDQIGRALLSKAKVSPALVCTDQAAMLAVDEYTEVPVAVVLSPEGGPLGDGRPDCRATPTKPVAPDFTPVRLGRNHLGLPDSSDNNRQRIVERLGPLGESFDLAEPFGRIREAIDEAQRAVRPAAPKAA